MVHFSENSNRLSLHKTSITSLDQLEIPQQTSPAVSLFYFPAGRTEHDASFSQDTYRKIAEYCSHLHKNSTVCVFTTPSDAVHILPILEQSLEFKLWIAVKITPDTYPQEPGKLPERHAALLVLTRYQGSLRHTKTRVQYTYCPTCGKTTKDYGGKKYTYHSYGTLISDVWRDIACNPFEDITPVIDRLQDLFGLEPYCSLDVLDLHSCPELLPCNSIHEKPTSRIELLDTIPDVPSQLLNEDCLQALQPLPDSSMDFCFADPPYNLQKKYSHWDDAMESIEYFSWCDQWLTELARVLKPGRTLAIVNIPLWSVRYYQHLCSQLHLTFQNWIVWDAMSFPVRMIMPAHYTILCFSKGKPRPLPGMERDRATIAEQETAYLAPSGETYCVRETCLYQRRKTGIADRGELSDLWYDMHRLKHNSHRVDHPCQLPPLLMRRLYALFTKPQEIILDCFNGAGTSTLIAEQMERRYVGVELPPQYHEIAQQRHEQLRRGEDPFAKHDTIPTSKNSRVQRLTKQRYAVSKKTLQLEVKRIAQQLGRISTREDVKRLSNYTIDYFDSYFVSWGEVCAAARTTGMSEFPPDYMPPQSAIQLTFDTLSTPSPSP